jgi:hypothetical protein
MSKLNSHFDAFNFNELLDMIRTIIRTKKCSLENLWKEGCGWESMEHLEAHVDDILEEIACRIREAWSFDRIQLNFKSHLLTLPQELLNMNNLNATMLNRILYKDPFSIGADLSTNGEEEIFIILNNLKYKMTKKGKILILT